MTGEIRISSLNCRGLCDRNKRKDVFDYLQGLKNHIYCLQDVHWDVNLVDTVPVEWGFDCYFAPGSNNSRGVAILMNKNFDFKVNKTKCSKHGNYIAIDVDISQYSITLIVIYGPNTDRPSFFHEIQEVVEDFNTVHCIIVGDWNVVLNPDLDTMNYLHVNNPRAREAVIQLMNELNLFDVWRVFHPTDVRFTWRQKSPLKQSRLDYLLASSGLLNTVLSTDISPGYRSDHSMISTSFKLCCVSLGRGYWKFNNSLLKDEIYVKLIKKVIDDTIDDYGCLPYNRENISNIHRQNIIFTISDQLFFETLLINILGKSISYSSSVKKEKHNRERFLLRGNSAFRKQVCRRFKYEGSH
ncbi:LINE-1 retrotransposable element ORF2 protein [Holothuria leucospilota]|uniref:exodeoxyribonuclease III n=1 Tax=Holothuria leucospilota TaxID=206669 RepID=A0A9Q1GZW1_HOLLE|nr:LINE-1 retrotransposable element ORF2 protein [Holothuria leucospilota]